MNLLFFSTSGFSWGGSEILWSKTVKLALSEGHTVAISIFDFDQQHESINELIELGAIPYFRRLYYPGILKRVKKKILNVFLGEGRKYTYNNELLNFKPDHLFFSLAGGNEIVEDEKDLFLFIKQLNVPFSVFYHSNLEKNSLSGCQKDLFRFVLLKSKYNFFTSKFQIQLIEDEIGIELQNSKVLSHPLREIEINEVNLGSDQEINMCIIGNIVFRWKGHDILINILSKMEWKNLNWKLNIYGEGSDKDKLKEMVIKHELLDRITFHGYQSNINEVFKKNHIVLIPSRKDSGPIVMYEAMMASLPVVGSYMGAMCDKIKTMENGVLANGPNEADFETAMSFAFENIESSKNWGAAGRRQMLIDYDFNSHVTLLNYLKS